MPITGLPGSTASESFIHIGVEVAMGQILLFTMLSGVVFVVQVVMYRSSK